MAQLIWILPKKRRNIKREKKETKGKKEKENKKIKIDSNQKYMYWLLITYDERVIWWLLF